MSLADARAADAFFAVLPVPPRKPPSLAELRRHAKRRTHLMAQVIVQRMTTGNGVTDADLRQAGFSQGEVDAYFDEARRTSGIQLEV